MNLIVGAHTTTYPGWVSTNIEQLDIRKRGDWLKYGHVDKCLAEHVWEHLTQDDGRMAAKVAREFCDRIRVAVPDGLFPDEAYVARAELGECEGDHLSLYNYATLGAMFRNAGWRVNLLEWWDNGIFHYVPWNPEDGYVMRSLRFDDRNKGDIRYTSLIIDAWRM